MRKSTVIGVAVIVLGTIAIVSVFVGVGISAGGGTSQLPMVEEHSPGIGGLYDGNYHREMRRYCEKSQGDRDQMRQYQGVLRSYGEISTANDLYALHIRNQPYGEEGLMFCGGREWARSNPEDVCAMVVRMRPSRMDEASRIAALGAYDYCKDTERIE